jgi:hypothetical protein
MSVMCICFLINNVEQKCSLNYAVLLYKMSHAEHKFFISFTIKVTAKYSFYADALLLTF